MNRLTEEQAKKYVKEKNKTTGVDAIGLDFLMSIDMDSLPVVVERGKSYGTNFVKFSNGSTYTFDPFTPRAGSIFFKPSFAGRQILMGKDEYGNLMFSNGNWFNA